MTFPGTIDYETLAQDAMRGVIRRILKQTEQSGLPGEHHFYISFDTCAQGVNLSKRLRERYPEEMTIVLQHRFWDLAVGDDQFEVKLTFDSIPERLVIPFKAIKVFFDPSVRYALQFETPNFEAAEADRPAAPRPATPAEGETRPSLAPVASTASIARFARPEETAKDSGPDAGDVADVPVDEPEPAARKDSDDGETTPGRDSAEAASDDDDRKPSEEGAVVVSLDAFRKK